jgi:hypothetical protein
LQAAAILNRNSVVPPYLSLGRLTIAEAFGACHQPAANDLV